MSRPNCLYLLSLLVCSRRHLKLSHIPKLSSFYSSSTQLSFRCSILFHEPDLYKSPWVPPPSCSSCLRVFSIFPLKTSQITLSAAALPLPHCHCSCPLSCDRDNLSRYLCLLLSMLHAGASNHPEVSPGSHYVSSVTQTLPSSWVIIFHCTSDLMLLLST